MILSYRSAFPLLIVNIVVENSSFPTTRVATQAMNDIAKVNKLNTINQWQLTTKKIFFCFCWPIFIIVEIISIMNI